METNYLLKLAFEHSVHLDDNKNYILGLVGFYSDNFIPNINEEISAAFRFSVGGKEYTFPIFCNQYLVLDLEKSFREGCLDNVSNVGKKKYNVKDFQISIQPELKLTIKTPIDFSMEPPLSKLLGFGDKN